MAMQARSLRDEDIAAVSRLIDLQEKRRYALDPRLAPPRDHTEITATIADQGSNAAAAPLVVCDEQGRIRGYAVPGTQVLPPDSGLLSFLGERDGTARSLTLPGPDEEDAESAARALIGALRDWWDDQGMTGAYLTHPSSEGWLEPLLHQQGFLTISVLAQRSPGSLAPSAHPPPPDLHARVARPQDEEVLVALYLESFGYHVPYDPTIRIVAGLEPAFRALLARQWNGESIAEGGPLVLVVERNGDLLAMSETSLLLVPPDSGDIRRPGRYCHIGSTGVRADARGRGVGRALAQAIFDAYAAQQVAAYELWYHLRNPRSSAFWPGLGWTPLLTRFVRRDGL